MLENHNTAIMFRTGISPKFNSIGKCKAKGFNEPL